jgi:putative phosphoribosyl transferase
MIFKDRVDAGKKLAEALKLWDFSGGIVLAIPRGGVVVGAEVARALKVGLDLIIPRKIGSPQNPEVAVGAVTQDGTTIFDDFLLSKLGLLPRELSDSVRCEMAEIKRRMEVYRNSPEYPDLSGRPVIVVDDGVATGYTMLAALRSVKKFEPLEVTLAIPVAPPKVLALLKEEVDRAVCLLTPENFYAVGQFYLDFDQTGDDEVVKLLKNFRQLEL